MTIAFLIYVNEFPDYLQSLSILFAADTSIVILGEDMNDTTVKHDETQSRANKWFVSNRLILNKNKCVNLLFTLKKVQPPDGYSASGKFLGIHVDSNLN